MTRNPLTGTERILRLVLYDALASEAMATLTTGVFLAGFLVDLGASNVAIGVLAAVPFAVQFLQLPAVVLVERLRTRRAICTWSAGVGRLFLLVAAMAPFVGRDLGIILLIASVAFYQALAAIAGCSWNSWMRDLVPETEFGRFFGRRAAATTALATALALACGLGIDRWKALLPDHPAYVYSAMFVFSAAIGFLGVWLLSITPDQPMPAATQRTPMHALFAAPFRDGNFRRLMIFLASWNFAANLAAPFFVVYMLKTVGYSMGTIIVLTTASQLSNLAALGLWGTLIDRFSNKAVLEIAAPLFLMCTLAWSFTGLAWIQPAVFFVLLAIHVLMGIATAGVALASGNIAMKLSPPGQATAYLASNSVVSATCAAIAPILGGLLADFFAARDLSFGFTWKGTADAVTLQVLNFHAWTFLFGLSAIVGLFSLHRLSFVNESAGTTDPLQVRHLLMEARRSVQGISSAAGLLRVVRVPSWLLRPRGGKAPRF
ncbi:MAG TPA: MFS transporter [Acetobacteraceae bacterium]|jgi:MFS family permease|nr:MFS transporter [Acetobacteraceae bacterium]